MPPGDADGRRRPGDVSSVLRERSLEVALLELADDAVARLSQGELEREDRGDRIAARGDGVKRR